MGKYPNSKMGKGQNEGGAGFSDDQIQMYKDCFKLMDINKDGILDKNDLRGAFDNVGVLMSESGDHADNIPILFRSRLFVIITAVYFLYVARSVVYSAVHCTVQHTVLY